MRRAVSSRDAPLVATATVSAEQGTNAPKWGIEMIPSVKRLYAVRFDARIRRQRTNASLNIIFLCITELSIETICFF